MSALSLPRRPCALAQQGAQHNVGVGNDAAAAVALRGSVGEDRLAHAHVRANCRLARAHSIFGKDLDRARGIARASLAVRLHARTPYHGGFALFLRQRGTCGQSPALAYMSIAAPGFTCASRSVLPPCTRCRWCF